MYRKREIPSALNEKQLAVTFRDLARYINFSTCGRAALSSPDGIICHGANMRSDMLPEWVHVAKLNCDDGKVILTVEADDSISNSEMDALCEKIIHVFEGCFRYSVKPFPRHVFCIGWPKTGTTSITEALRILGLFSWHFAPWIIGLDRLTTTNVSPVIDFDCINDYTAVSDLPVCALFKELDQAFPGSLFIFTTRPVESWSESMISMCDRIVRNYKMVDSVMQWAHSTANLSKEIIRARYLRHEREVFQYFGDRKDLLVIDVSCGNPWPALCDFLGLPQPDVPFPHLNRRGRNSLSASK